MRKSNSTRRETLPTYLSHAKTLEQQLNLKRVVMLRRRSRACRISDYRAKVGHEILPKPTITFAIVLTTAATGEILSSNDTQLLFGLRDEPCLV